MVQSQRKLVTFRHLWSSLLSANNFSGEIPTSFGNLKNLTDIRLNGTLLSGKIPDFIGNWTKRERLDVQGTSMEGPTPSSISLLTSLTALDLSFNRLTGKIPDTFQNLNQLDYMFLTNNSLSGPVPSFITSSKEKLNLVSSFAISGNNTVPWCLKKDLPCPGKAKYHSLFINCGGDEVPFDGNTYVEDTSAEAASSFLNLFTTWAFSSTGVYVGKSGAPYKINNPLSLNISGSQFYQTACVSPLSLKYYGLCMRQGSYKVQREMKLKDFNIMDRAGAAGRGICEDFDNIIVNGSTLEINLYWAGKGTTAIPDRGVYGPLISAIAVTPNFDVGNGGYSAGTITGIAVSSFVLLVLILLLVLWLTGFLGGKDHEDKELLGVDMQTGHFTLRQIKSATSNFDPANKIGEGGFGPVYKGNLSDGTAIAVKQLSSKSRQGNREFLNEIGIILALQHPNLVRLYGCCIEGNQLLLTFR